MGGGPNTEAMQRLIEAFTEGDVDRVLAHVHPEVEMEPLPEVATEPYRGHEGVRRFFNDRRGWDELSFQVQRVVPGGDCVAVLGRYRSRRGGVIHDSPAAWAGFMREGKLVRSESFLSWDDALERCGVTDVDGD